jgi:hypothetical protein
MEERSATFHSTSFATGRFRRAYKGTWTAPRKDAGRACVVKELKDNYTWRAADWEETLKINGRAKDLAMRFTSRTPAGYKIAYTDVHVLRVVSTCDPCVRPKLNEYMTCEDYIPGQFQKWCNNYGYISGEYTILPALMHWSWFYTCGEEMISDLQGVRNGNAYTLTDSAMLSLSGSYGVTDTGVEGMAMFFLKHNCDRFCQSLPKPTLTHFHHIIPQQYLWAAETLLGQVQSSTTYSFELKFPQGLRGRVIEKFHEIANS